MSNSTWKLDDDKVICKIYPSVEVNRYDWTITFSSNLYDFLKERFGDVHLWSEQQQYKINMGQMNFSQLSMKIMKRVMRGEKLPQRTIGNLIRAYGFNLWLDSLDF
jgi:hypothetical protein